MNIRSALFYNMDPCATVRISRGTDTCFDSSDSSSDDEPFHGAGVLKDLIALLHR